MHGTHIWSFQRINKSIKYDNNRIPAVFFRKMVPGWSFHLFYIQECLSEQMDSKGTGRILIESAKLSLLQGTLAKCHCQNVRTFILLENYTWSEKDAWCNTSFWCSESPLLPFGNVNPTHLSISLSSPTCNLMCVLMTCAPPKAASIYLFNMCHLLPMPSLVTYYHIAVFLAQMACIALLYFRTSL